MVTYVDNINSLTCYPQYAGQTDVVFQCVWTKSGTDGTYHGSYSAGCELTYTAGSPFTPYDQLTQAQVLAWVYAATPPEYIANMEAEIAKNIADQANPPTVTLPLPWNIPAPPPPDMSEPPAPATE